MQINRDRSLTDVALTITYLLEKNLVITYDADKILWALLDVGEVADKEEQLLQTFFKYFIAE